MLFHRLIKLLNSQDIKYCHWKSNRYLGDIRKGEVEYDLLIARQYIAKFEALVIQLGFKRAIVPHAHHLPGVHHFYGYDGEEDLIVHIHAFYNLITGESIAKNYRLPFERMLLQHQMWQDDIPIPPKSAQLVIFVIRMMVKHGSLIEMLLAWREYDSIIEELDWLTSDEQVIPQALEQLEAWVPSIDATLFCTAIGSLRNRSSFVKRMIVGRVFKCRLRLYRRYPPVKVFFLTMFRLLRGIKHRIEKTTASIKSFPSGGAVIAFVGPEATGKSTLVTEAHSFLGRFCHVEIVHLGKPPSTAFSILPNLLLPFLKKLIPSLRTSRIESSKHNGIIRQDSFLKMIILAIRAIMVARDRRVLATKIFRKAARGAIIICDRYPSNVVGAADSPRLDESNEMGVWSHIYRIMVRIERKIYASIPTPDYVIRLSVPLEVALSRNEQRRKKGNESDEYVRRRHEESNKASFPASFVYDISTEKPLEESVREVRKAMWNML